MCMRVLFLAAVIDLNLGLRRLMLFMLVIIGGDSRTDCRPNATTYDCAVSAANLSANNSTDSATNTATHR